MKKVKNKKIIKTLAQKSFKAAKTRNRIAVVAILLTTLLFTSLMTLGIGMNDSFIYNNLRQGGGDGHAVYKYLTQKQYEDIKHDSLIKKISYNRIASDSVDNPEFLKRRVEMYQMDDTAREMGFCENEEGSSPKGEYDINIDSRSLELLGVEKKIGEKVPLTYTVKDKQYTTEFTLTGWWETDPVALVGMAVVSEEFMKAREDIYQVTEKENGNLSGSINSYVLFYNTFDLEGKMRKVLENNGYLAAEGDLSSVEKVSNEEESRLIACNVNWAYMTGDFMSSIPAILAVLAGCFLIGVTGYLIIYNIFQISVIRDIRFYGLLKTIGTTGKQVKAMIRRQALLLCCFGIPLGLIAGYAVGAGCLPILMSTMQDTQEVGTRLTLHPWIFIGAAAFAIFTVLISTNKPGKMAAKVSPVEAVRYTIAANQKKKEKKSTDGGKIFRMALSNLSRNKKRTVLSLLSMSLSLVILLAVFTLSRGFDMDKFVSKFCKTDFQVAHAQYFQFNYFGQKEDVVNDSFIQSIEQQPSFSKGGRTLFTREQVVSVIDEDAPAVNCIGYPLTDDIEKDGSYLATLIGQDDYIMESMDAFEGELDMEKMKSGDYILVGVNTDDNGEPIPASSTLFELGESITLNIGDTSKEFKVLAKTGVNGYTDSTRWFSEYTFYLPAEVYTKITGHSNVMFYSFDVNKGMEEEMISFLDAYTQDIEKEMDYTGKETYTSQFMTMKNAVLLIGGGLSFIVGLIGILNFVNSMITSIFSRNREFAMLEAIGMTGKQIQAMLKLEGIYYGAGTIILSLFLGSVLSLTVIQTLIGQMWFFTYRFVIWPILIVCPLILLLGIAVPAITERMMREHSVVDRLRMTE